MNEPTNRLSCAGPLNRPTAWGLLGVLALSLVLALAPAPAAFAADCLEYEFFFRRGGVFPNPFNNTTQPPITGYLTLLIIDEDLNMHLARVEREAVYNIKAQEVIPTKKYGTLESDREVLLTNLWDGRDPSGNPVASANYPMRLFSDSTVCGRKSTAIISTVLR
ncbi:MAG: hypothetical protein KDD47_02405 [Acidobacteria bacterium]|nr:hypothetical protein [Acidobacteriota bacterium]